MTDEILKEVDNLKFCNYAIDFKTGEFYGEKDKHEYKPDKHHQKKEDTEKYLI